MTVARIAATISVKCEKKKTRKKEKKKNTAGKNQWKQQYQRQSSSINSSSTSDSSSNKNNGSSSNSHNKNNSSNSESSSSSSSRFQVPEFFMAAFVGCPLMYQFYNLLRKHVERLRQQNVEALVDYYVKLLNYMDLPAEQRQVYKTVGSVEAVRFRRQGVRLFQGTEEFPWKVEKVDQQALCSYIPNWCRCLCLAKTETHWRVDDETCTPKASVLQEQEQQHQQQQQ